MLIRGGTVVTEGGELEADILVEAGRIAEVRPGIAGDGAIDATGLYVLPGLVDAHSHARSVPLAAFAMSRDITSLFPDMCFATV